MNTADGFDADLVVRRVVPVTHDVTSFVFERPALWSGRYHAGQHLVLTQRVAGAEIERCYTIASPPTRTQNLTITVKRHEDGRFSPWLHENLRPGSVIRGRGPFGEFTLEAAAAARTADRGPEPSAYLFLTAGSGITPAMSMTRTLADAGSDTAVAFVHSARSPADIIFRRELAALPETGLGVNVTIVCEDDQPADRWDGPRGRLSADLLRWAVPDVARREVFLCGPPGYLAAAGAVLDALGVDPDRIHLETFTIGAASDLFRGADARRGGARIELRRTGASVTCPPDSSVLDAVLEAGVMLRSSCRQGLCGTCKLTLLEGRVDMRHQGGIRPRELDRGLFLPCCSRPLTDLVVDA